MKYRLFSRSLLALFAFLLLPCLSVGVGLGDPKALKGGNFIVALAAYPKYLHYYLGFDEHSQAIAALVHEPLVEADEESYKIIPRLAKKWTESKDHKTFVFTLDPQARFSDGKPVTAQDVKFTWDLVMNPANKTAPFASRFSSFVECNIVDEHTVRFLAKEAHFKNLAKLIDFYILPKHFYDGHDFNRDFSTRLLGSGPYTVEKVEVGERIVLKRNPNYWGSRLTQNTGRYNFNRITFRASSDYDAAFERFKKGDIDYFYVLISKMWEKETNGPLFQRNYAKKLKGENALPYSTPGIIWNLRRPLFADVNIRKALASLLNRQRFIHELFYDNYGAATGPVPFRSVYHSPENRPIPFDPKEAKRLLQKAGWTQLDSDGYLVKEGRRFEFDLLLENAALAKAFTVYQEDLKQMGIKLNLRIMDWTAMIKLMDERNFDAVNVSRQRETLPSDFSVMWGSKAATIAGSDNVGGYQNPKIDELAMRIDHTYDEKSRIPLIQKIDKLIGDDQPMAFTWETLYFRVLYWNRYSFPGKGFFRYSYWWTAFQYWWLDPEKEKALKNAMASGVAL